MKKGSPKNYLSLIPSVDSILLLPQIEKLSDKYSRTLVTGLIQSEIGRLRREISQGKVIEGLNREQITKRVVTSVSRVIEQMFRPSLRRVINATGIIVHTGLGRAPLCETARESIQKVCQGYSNVEINVESGKRGHRIDHVERLLCYLTGAEAAAVVNNNAAAVLISLNTLSKGKEAIISRGELIEIGESFRMPDIMKCSGARMVEVGTTNRTHLWDFERAINENTGAILHVHTSNYRVLGFTKEVALEELVRLGKKHHLPIIHDLGGGVLVDLTKFGLPHEPLTSQSIKKGADVVTFSGDKVMGGPQAGIIVGRKRYIDLIKKNPLMRALRCGKLTYGALESTLKLYFDENSLSDNLPVLKMMTESEKTVERRAKRLVDSITRYSLPATINVEKIISQVGGGALPLEEIPSFAVSLKPKDYSVERLAKHLRKNEPPIFAYIKDGRLYLDMRTVCDEDMEEIAKAISRLSK